MQGLLERIASAPALPFHLASAGCSELLASWHTSLRALSKASQGCPTNGPFKSALEGHGLIKAIGQDADESVSGSGRINRLDWLRFDTLAVPSG